MRKKVKFIEDQIDSLSMGKEWKTSSYYKEILRRISESPLENVHLLATYLKEKQFSSLSKEDADKLTQIVTHFEPIIRTGVAGYKDRPYWDRDENKLVENGLFETAAYLMGQHMAYSAVSQEPVPPMTTRVSPWSLANCSGWSIYLPAGASIWNMLR